MTEHCLDLRMNLKSEMTMIMYADKKINNLIHNKIYQWYNFILSSIYSNDEIKGLIVSFLQLKKIIMPNNGDNLKKFIHDTFSITDLSEDQKMKRENKINEAFMIYEKSHNPADLFLNSSVFDLFFIIYLKGGMATRFICMLLNTLSGGNMFTQEILQEQLGAVSDYDFNCIINPTFERPVYEKFYTTLKNLLTNVFAHLTTDAFFNDPLIKNNLIQNASAAAAKFPIIYSSGCNPTTNQRLGYSSSMEITQKFGLVRLMAQVQIACAGKICFKDESGSVKNTTSINAELIDISFPLFDNLEERNHAWIYANKAVSVKWCSIEHNACVRITSDNEKYNLTDKIRVYSLHSAIDDLTSTIRDTELRGDTAKIAKRKKRLEFFKHLICQYALLVNSSEGTINQADISKYCVENVEELLCGNEYIDEDTSLILAQFSLGLKQDTNLVFGIMDKYINYIITYSNNPVEYKSQLLATYTNDYRNFMNSLSQEQLNQIKSPFCYLLINAISLNKSLNDNFIIAFIGFLFLHTLSMLWFNYSVFIFQTTQFNQKLIDSMEFLNNGVTRPIINKYFNFIIENLWTLIKNIYKPEENIQVLIRGGCAVHMNIMLDQSIVKSSPVSMNTNDIDIVINLERYDYQLIIGIQSLFETILSGLKQTYPQLDLKFEYVMTGQLFQVIMDYDSKVVHSELSIYTSSGAINVHTLIPRIRHHILEINFLNSPSKVYSENQIVHLYPNDGNRECVFYSSGFLIKEYNKILMESKHWYRKSKYLRRIAALNRVITNYPSRKNYESEFPLPC